MSETPLRRSAKVLFHDPAGRTLLFQGCDPLNPSGATWWFPPGGGLENDESHEQAAVREVFEETGQHVSDLGPIVASSNDSFTFRNRTVQQETVYFTKATEAFQVDRSGWTEHERLGILDVRWWTLEELRVTREVVWPEDLVALLEAAIHARSDDSRPTFGRAANDQMPDELEGLDS